MKENGRESLDETRKILRVYYWDKPGKSCLTYPVLGFLPSLGVIP